MRVNMEFLLFTGRFMQIGIIGVPVDFGADRRVWNGDGA